MSQWAFLRKKNYFLSIFSWKIEFHFISSNGIQNIINRWIVTAAHCLTPNETIGLYFSSNSNGTFKKKKTVSARYQTIYPLYNDTTFTGDIGKLPLLKTLLFCTKLTFKQFYFRHWLQYSIDWINWTDQIQSIYSTSQNRFWLQNTICRRSKGSRNWNGSNQRESTCYRISSTITTCTFEINRYKEHVISNPW